MKLKTSWPVFFCAAFLFAFPLFAKEKPLTGASIIAQSMQSLGGENKFRRLENIHYDFAETRQTPNGPVSVNGRHYFKMRDGAGFRGREETSSAKNDTLTIFNSSGIWHWENGREVKDPQVLASIKEEILQKAFWLAAPFHIQGAQSTLDYAGLGYIEGKLDRRVNVRIATTSYPLPDMTSFTLFFDTATYQLDGVSYAAPDGKSQTQLLDRYVGTSIVEIPSRRILMDSSHNMVEQFSIIRPQVNNFFDDALLDPAAVKPASSSASPSPAAKPR